MGCSLDEINILQKRVVDLNVIELAAKECYSCNICVKECAFLQNNGTPGRIFDRYLQGHVPDKTLPFQCNLCGLCSIICPKNIDNTAAFRQMRKELAVGNGQGMLPVHSTICGYEKRGGSKLFSMHYLPKGCDTVFFPGCTLAGTRSETTLKCYEHIQSVIPSLGMILDCCSKPSHDLGREPVFQKQFGSLLSSMRENGVKRVITACPSCHVTFEEYTDFEVVTVYELLADKGISLSETFPGVVAVHDTCVTRNNSKLHDAVRTLITTGGAEIDEVEHSREKAICCGEGGAASFVVPEWTAEWKARRKQEVDDRKVVTYCAGCSHTLGREVDTVHLLDLLFDTKRAVKGKSKVARSPFTYLKRLRLKQIISSKRGR